jgi:hypothetical protein
MKALEMGLMPPGESIWPAAVCIAIGAVVPIGALVAALVATLHAPPPHGIPSDLVIAGGWGEDFYGMVWGSAAGVGCTAVIAGAILAWRLIHRHERGQTAAQQAPDFEKDKPAFDPDAYDTVGTRG